MATMVDRPVFMDTNVLIYAYTKQAPLHESALDTIQRLWGAGTELWISRQIVREFLATFTRPQTFAQPHPMETVIARVRFFQTQFHVADEDHTVTEKLLALLAEVPVGGRQVHDANVVATMQAYNIEHLLTHNVTDFACFADYIRILPLAKAKSALDEAPESG